MADVPASFPTPPGLYDPACVARLFDEMSATYGVVNVFSSFGFCIWWRRQCLNLVQWKRGDRVLDLMAGMGELLPGILRRTGRQVAVTAVDLSREMCAKAKLHAMRRSGAHFTVLQADALNLPVADESVDVVVSSFGLKTFSPDQIQQLARQVRRVLRPGGRFAFLEISIPPLRLLRWPYLFYLRHIIPVLGKLFLGNPDNYRMLAIYTEAFGQCSQAATAFEAAGLHARITKHFFGCATAISGSLQKE